jgi:hypothetical protein
MSQHFLTDLLVLELGHRLAVSACGSVLSELGCEVVSVLGPGRQESDDLRAGKRSLQWHAPLAGTADETLLLQLIARADVVLLSPDADPAWPTAFASALQQARTHVADQPINGGRRKQAGCAAANENTVHAAPPDEGQAVLEVGTQSIEVALLR